MKKISAVILAALMLTAFLAPAGAEQGNPAAGDWYASLSGVILRLSLNADGTYERALPVGLGEPEAGTWKFENKFVCLDDGSVLSFVNADLLVFTGAGLLFTREKKDTYVPGQAWTDAPVILYSDYWEAAYADMAGTPVPVSVLKDETDLLVEDYSAILGGPVLGDVIVKLAEQDGALATEHGSLPEAALLLQQDGMLRLTVTQDTLPKTWYMMRSYPPFRDGEKEAGQ